MGHLLVVVIMRFMRLDKLPITALMQPTTVQVVHDPLPAQWPNGSLWAALGPSPAAVLAGR